MEGEKDVRGMTSGLAAIVAIVSSLCGATGARAQNFDNLVFHTVTPCRLFDTRISQGGTGPLASQEIRGFNVFGATLSSQGGDPSGCGLPELTTDGVPQTIAIAVTMASLSPQGSGTLKMWAGDISQPVHATVVDYQSISSANTTAIAVRTSGTLGTGSDIVLRANGAATDVLGDVVGYYSQSARQTQLNAESSNLISGSGVNTVPAGVVGATIGGGGSANNSETFGPTPNRVLGNYGTVGGGAANDAGTNQVPPSDSRFATVSGGQSNVASGGFSTIGGGVNNSATSNMTTVGGGFGNTATNSIATIAGGQGNSASGGWATVGGGIANSAAADGATIGGGGGFSPDGNIAMGTNSTIAGGTHNFIGNPQCLNICGGPSGCGTNGAIGGGSGNVAGNNSTVAGGIANKACFEATVGGGQSNTASGTFATVPGGSGNLAQGNGSFAAGVNAQATDDNSFVWGDGSQTASSTGAKTFSVLAIGGIGFFPGGGSCGITNPGNLTCSGSITPGSDRHAKENFAPIDSGKTLERVVALPVSRWNFIGDGSTVQHIGPMAQDFYAAFKVGADDKHIATVDADGVALAAIQGLYKMLQERDAKIAKLEKEKNAEIADVRARLSLLEREAASRRSSGAPLASVR